MSGPDERFARSSFGRRRALSFFLCSGFLLPRIPRAASSHDVRLIVGEDSPAQRLIVDAFRKRYPNASVDRDPVKLKRVGQPRAYVAVGPMALQAGLSAQLDAPLISLFTSRQTYARLMTERPAPARAAVTAIYAEPSPAQQMRLIAALYKRQVSVGAMLSPQTAYMGPLLEQAAREQHLDLTLQRVDPEVGLVRTLTTLTAVTALLIFPDASLYTPQNLRQLLEASYRRSQPVIGFSAGLVAAGTLASAYSSVEDTLAQLDDFLESLAVGRVPDPQYPRYWSVVVNDRVAHSLNVVVDDVVRSMGDRPP